MAEQAEVEDRSRRSFGDAREAVEFVEMLERFERGELSADDYRKYRLTRGIYGQRQDGANMVRVKIPQGVLSGAQLRVLADCADRWSRGYGHVTTRQNIQFHFVKPHDVGPFMEAVAIAGLTTREACSHAVRNVAACAWAGVCADAPFDVTPYAEAVTRHFLRGPLGSGLPRKFKISASGCAEDCGQGAINDIGLQALIQDGRRGFRVRAGGGLSTLPRSAPVLFEFLPAEHLLAACEAIAAVFNVEGERKNLKKARMKWAIQRLGWDRFAALVREKLDQILASGGRPYEVGPEEPPPRPRRRNEGVALSVLGPGFAEWRDSNVRAQRQEGYHAATVRLRSGDVSSGQMRALADTIGQLGDGTLRTTNEQNLLIRWVRAQDLAALHAAVDRIGLSAAHAGGLSDVVTCPGAETCRIAVTASRGVAQLVRERLEAVDGQHGEGEANIKVSGCPNGCGQHHVGTFGLQGGVRRFGEKLIPQYHLTIGGGIDAEGARFGRLVGKVPARRVPEAIERLVSHWRTNRREGETQRQYFRRLDVRDAASAIADLTEITPETAQPDDFVDPGSTTAFEVVELDGECAQ